METKKNYDFRIKFIPNKYPFDNPYIVAKYVCRKNINKKTTFLDAGITIETAESCFNFCRAVEFNKPVTSKIVTIDGDNIMRKGNYVIPNGTSYEKVLDFCYLVNPYFPPKSLVEELKANFEVLLESYPSGDRQQSLLAGKIFGINPDYIAVGNGAAELISGYADFIEGKVVVPYPTFNEYPERLGSDRTIWLKTDENFGSACRDTRRG